MSLCRSFTSASGAWLVGAASHHLIMDPLSLLREYTIARKEFQMDGDTVTFGDERFDLTTPTAYKSSSQSAWAIRGVA
jgi:hypothetical protein